MVKDIDAEDIWKRIGLEKLRESLRAVNALSGQFETALRKLPACNQCARSEILKRIKTSGTDLSGEVVSLSVLASSLQNALVTAEKAKKELCKNAPNPCECSGEKCSCHE